LIGGSSLKESDNLVGGSGGRSGSGRSAIIDSSVFSLGQVSDVLIGTTWCSELLSDEEVSIEGERCIILFSVSCSLVCGTVLLLVPPVLDIGTFV
jgi:hypothetical protein